MNRCLLFLFTPACIALFSIVSSPANAQTPTDSLLLHLPFDGNANDASGNNNHGTVHNAVLDTDRYGVPNSAYRFNGLDSYIEIPASQSMNKIQTSDVVSISAWININAWHSSGNVFSIFERYNAGTDAGWLYEANWAGGGIIWLADETSATNYAGCNYTWNFHQWYFVCLTYNQAGDTAHFYVDGAHVCATPYSAPINLTDTTSSFVIGRSLAGPDEYSDGLIDDLRVYNRVLTASEVGSIFSSTRGMSATRPLIVSPNPASEYVELRVDSRDVRSELVITDATGRTVTTRALANGLNKVDINDLPAGVYVYRLSDSESIATGRLVVQ